MPKHFIRRHLPDPDKIARAPGLGFLRHHLEDPNLWHLNRRSAAGAMFWGLWFAFLPMPLHTIPAVIVALVFRINLPLTIAMVWMVNPLTMLPCFYLGYDVGALLLNRPAISIHEIGLLVNAIENMGRETANTGNNINVAGYLEPFLLGMLVTGFVLGCTGYLGMNWYWRRHVLRSWQKRRKRQAAGSDEPAAPHR